MNAIEKTLAVVALIDNYPNNYFQGLNPFQKTRLASMVVQANPDVLANPEAFMAQVISIFYDLHQHRIFQGLTFFEQLQMAVQMYEITTAGAPQGDPVTASDAEYAQNVLTITRDLGAGDTLQIDDKVFTFVAADAPFTSAKDIILGEDVAETVTNILYVLNNAKKINGEDLKKVQLHEHPLNNTKLSIRAAKAGAGGNSIATVLTTEGTSAFDSPTLTGGVNAVKATAGWTGRVGVNAKGQKKIYLGNEWHWLLTQEVVQYGPQSYITARQGTQASATLTVKTFAAGNTINIGDITLTAVAEEATPGPGEYCVHSTPAAMVDNILAAISLMSGLEFSAALMAETTDKIVFTFHQEGVIGNSIPTTVTTQGLSAFDDLTMTGGTDGELGTPMVSVVSYSSPPDRIVVVATSAADLETLPLHIRVPEDYVFDHMEIITGDLETEISKVMVKDAADTTLIEVTDTVTNEVLHVIRPMPNHLCIPGTVKLYLTGNSEPGTTIKAIFNRINNLL